MEVHPYAARIAFTALSLTACIPSIVVGDLLWSSQFSSPLDGVNDEALGAGGNTWTMHKDNSVTSDWWLRGFALE